MRSRIVGTGSWAPAKVVSNHDLAKRLDTSDAWIVERTGIRERRVADDGQAASDLALAASRAALDSCSLDAASLDLIVVGTVTGDMPFPSTAAVLQGRLGAKNAFAFDVAAACAGSIFGIGVADQYLRTGACRRALVVGVDLMSRLVDWQDRSTAVLFGDGAGAVVLEAGGDERGILSTHLRTDGTLTEVLYVPGPGSRRPASEALFREGADKLRMNGREVYKAAVRNLTSAAEEALAANGVSADQLALVACHQANLRILEAVVGRLGVPLERCALNLDRYGNTSAASMLMGLDEARRAGRLAQGDLVLLLAMGAGLAWGSALVRW